MAGLATAAPAAGIGHISGRVSEAAASHKPIAGIEVCPYNELQEELAPPSCATTNSSGEYTLSGLAEGRYAVEFSSPVKSGLNYITQYYNGKFSERAADVIEITAAKSSYANIDAEMVEGGKIAGKVTDATTAAPVENVLVCAVTNAEMGGCAITAGDGGYTIAALATGDYRVASLGPRKYVTQYYNGKLKLAEAETVHVTQGAVTSGIDAALQPSVTPAPPTNLIPPAISGSATPGASLSCSNGLWTASPAPTFTYRWLRDGGAIIGAAATSTYTVQAGDEGHSLSCEVTATNRSGQKSATSASVSVALMQRPVAVLTLLSSKLILVKGKIRVHLECAAAGCSGRLMLEQLVRRYRSGKRPRPPRTAQILGSANISLAAGMIGVVTLKLNAAGRARFAHDSHHPQAAELVCIVKGASSAHLTVLVK